MTDGAVRWHGLTAEAWAERLGVPVVEVHPVLDSTNDRAHAIAEAGAPAGTVVLADAQRAGRGRPGKSWASAPGAGVWCSVVERPQDLAAVQVLALRVGLALAEALAPLAAPQSLTLKWPNDLFADDHKLAGVLIEARWVEQRPSHVVIGVGVNLVAPVDPPAAALGAAHGAAALAAVVHAARSAAATRGGLTDDERAAWAARDRAVGRAIVAPGEGIVVGIAADGGLQVRTGAEIATFHAGSLVFA